MLAAVSGFTSVLVEGRTCSVILEVQSKHRDLQVANPIMSHVAEHSGLFGLPKEKDFAFHYFIARYTTR